MNNSSHEISNGIQNVVNVNSNDKKNSKDTFNTEKVVQDASEKYSNILNNANNENILNGFSQNDPSILGVSDKIDEQVVNGKNISKIKTYDNFYTNDSSQTKYICPPNNYNHFNSPSLDRTVRNSSRNIYNFDTNNAWYMNYPSNFENFDYLNMRTASSNLENAYNLSYNSVNNKLAPPENIGSPLYARTNMQKNSLFNTSFNLNPNSKLNPFFKRMRSGSPLKDAQFNSLYNPTFSSYESSSPHINYDNFQSIPPQFYYLVKDKDNCSFLKRGMNCAKNSCNLNMNESHAPKYEYIIQGPKLPYLNYQNQKKFNVFKKLTLTLGTYLDDAVNIMIGVMETSIRSIKKNNTNLYDLCPFYNPDPIYSRQERPTLKTGSKLLDKINCALDGTTLERHKNMPASGRIPVPKTEKTGYVFVDEINNILDNLLNEPMSYQNYDYFSDKFKHLNEKKNY